ncbi:hypothetical protein C2G38_2199861 [Gigaspora rosea]|uniref:CCHC-type domain-containing protein n=1 Tax=Gigaspora rosea TaxID=44941 RepID=A0A397UYU6_9GLOM|nr:hypothetical protein C2G38_2199861 [Gigaspora rosea]
MAQLENQEEYQEVINTKLWIQGVITNLRTLLSRKGIYVRRRLFFNKQNSMNELQPMELSNTDYQNRGNDNSMCMQPLQFSIGFGGTNSQESQLIYCLSFKCPKCRRQGHNHFEYGKQCHKCGEYHINTSICPPIEDRKKPLEIIREIKQKEKECNYCHEKGHIEQRCQIKEIYQKNLNIEYGCSESMIYQIGGRKRLYCHEYQYFFMLILPHGDEQRNEILKRLEKEGLI